MSDALLDIDRLRAFSSAGSDRAREAGEKVAKRRAEVKLSQQRLAVAAGTTLQTIFRIERGELVPREYLRQAIAYALMVEVDALWPNATRQEIHDAAVANEAIAS